MLNRERLNFINKDEFDYNKEYFKNNNKKYSINNFNENKYNNDVKRIIGDDNLFDGNNEMERLKKKLYDEIRNDDKYRRIYKPYNSMRLDNNRGGYNRPLSYNRFNDNYYNNRNYYDNNKNDVVYRMLFDPNEKNLKRKSGNSFYLLNNNNNNNNNNEITKGEGNINKIYGGIEFNN